MSSAGLILVGGGGHCRSTIDVISREGKWRIAGILDTADKIGMDVLGHSVIGTDDRIIELARSGHCFLVTTGHVGDPTLRVRLAALIAAAGGELARVISPLAYVASSAHIAPGNMIGHFAMVNAASKVEANSIINSHALVEHDSTIGMHCHIATGAVINGGCTIGEGTLVGSGAILLQGMKIGRYCRIGAGAVVTKEVNDGLTVMGCPATER
jgi:sugar O-acyltransferase (sialic acid O-acetyltransferase NeuD family)